MKHLETVRRERPVSLLCGILGVLSVLIVIVFGYENGTPLSTVIKLSVLSVVLLAVVIFYILIQHEKVNEKPRFYLVFGILYLGSLLCILLVKNRPEVTIWMTGGLLTAMLFNMFLGYMVTFVLVFFASFAGGYQLEFIVYLFILGTFMCLLSGYMKKYATIGYTAVIILSMQLILIFVINNFILVKSLSITAVYSLLSTLTAIVISFLIYTVYNSKNRELPAKEETAVSGSIHADAEDIRTAGDTVNVPDAPENMAERDTWTLEEVLDIDFPLLKRLKECSEKVYRHSLLISELSQKAARAVGADEYKAKAGGLYHEIGRIANKEYVEEGIKLAEEYHLPGVISDMIRQHNIKYEKPRSPEAAIVMITISITATKEYLEKAEKSAAPDGQAVSAVPMGKIVDNVFQMRLSKGSLDESGLTLKQFNDLKEFFLHM